MKFLLSRMSAGLKKIITGLEGFKSLLFVLGTKSRQTKLFFGGCFVCLSQFRTFLPPEVEKGLCTPVLLF